MKNIKITAHIIYTFLLNDKNKVIMFGKNINKLYALPDYAKDIKVSLDSGNMISKEEHR